MKEVYSSKSSSVFGAIKVSINIDIDREFTEEEKSFIYKAGCDINDLLYQTSWAKSPNTIENILMEEKQLLYCFPQPIYVERIPNGYTRSPYPWYIVTTPKGRIKIGWRKRVISIDWSDSVSTYDGNLFQSENVTCESRLVHAWSYEKAKEYLERILS